MKIIKTGERSKVFLCKKEEMIVVHFFSDNTYKNMLYYLDKINSCKFSAHFSVYQEIDNSFITPKWGDSLYNLRDKISLSEKITIKKQIVEQIKDMHKQEICHRDLHVKNICWNGKEIRVIDWEYITDSNIKNNEKISTHYDLTGKGVTVPPLTMSMNLLANNKYSIKRFLAPLTLAIEDFDD